MKSGNDLLARLGPNSLVDLLVEKAKDLDGKDDLRRTRILDITDDFVILEQPAKKIHPNRAGNEMGLTYIKRDEEHNLVREILDARLIKFGKFKLKDGVTDALFFDYPSKVYVASVRRHFRVEIPRDEDVFVVIMDLAGHPIGSEGHYRIIDLSLQGLKFLCKKGVKTKQGFLADPVSRLSVNDEILTRIFVDTEELLWTKSIIRAKISPKDPKVNVVYFGIEFIERVMIGEFDRRLKFHKYSDKDQRSMMSYINDIQRRALRDEQGV